MKGYYELILINITPALFLILVFASILTPYWYHIEGGGSERDVIDYGLFWRRSRLETDIRNETVVSQEQSETHWEWLDLMGDNNGSVYEDAVQCGYLSMILFIIGIVAYVISVVFMNYSAVKNLGGDNEGSSKKYLISLSIALIIFVISIIYFSVRFPTILSSPSYSSHHFGISWFLMLLSIGIVIIDGSVKFFLRRRLFGSPA